MIETIKAYDLVSKRLNDNIRGLKAHPCILDKKEHGYLYPVYEKTMYIAISASDLNIALKYLDVSSATNNGYETNYFARNVAHISYELINHQQKIVGKEISEIVKKNLGDEGLKEIKVCTKELKSVSKDYHQKLNYIRNNLIAHRVDNGSVMANSMLDIDSSEIWQIGKKVFSVHINLIGAYINLLGTL